MIKLKTLKDISECWGNQLLRLENEVISIDKLKEEAIKWVKDIDNFEKLPEERLWENITGKRNKYAIDAMSGVRNWIKHLFNITSEDFK